MKGKIKDGSNPQKQTTTTIRKQDTDLSDEYKYYRLGIEWAKICPEEDTVDRSAIQHYRDELAYLKEKDIEVLLTLHHFTNPMWFERKGGFTKSGNLKYFMDFVKLATESFGDLVSEYITINEPNVYATISYFYGEWPPGEKSLIRACKVMSNMAVCHIEAYRLIHAIRKEMGYSDTKVSFANHVRNFDPENPRNILHRTYARLMAWFFQGAVTKAMTTGEFKWPPLKKAKNISKGEYFWISLQINYYTRDHSIGSWRWNQG